MNNYMKKRSGTSFKGYLLSTFTDVTAVFGKPTAIADNYKVDAEWVIDTPYGVATIYNYKDGKSYLGSAGLEVEAICEWHVGGKTILAYDWVKQKLVEHKIDTLA